MSQYSDQVTDSQYGAPIAGASVYVYDSDDALAALTDDNDDPIDNPVITDQYGNFEFHAADGYYSLRYVVGGKQVFEQEGVLVGVPPALVVTSAPGQAVSTRVLLAAIAAPVDLQPALLTEAGREGEFKWRSGNYAARVTGDPAQAIYVASSTIATTAGAWVRIHAQGWYKAGWFGVKADDATDDTTALQRIFNYLEANGGGTVFYPEGVSVVGGARQDGALSNSQLVLPKITGTTVAIRLIGAAASASGDPQSGTIWRSTLHSGTGGAVLGCKTAAELGRSELHLTIENITIRQPQNPILSAFDFSYLRAARAINCRADVDDVGSGLLIAEPTHAESYGVLCPANNVSARCDIDIQVVGYYTAFLVGELVYGNATATFCKTAMITRHGLHRARLNLFVYSCKRIIYGDQKLQVSMLVSVEHNPEEAVPDWVLPRWSDIEDPDNNLRGTCDIAFHDQDIEALEFVGADDLEIIQVPDFDEEPAVSWGMSFPTFDTITNRSSVRLLRTFNGGLPFDNIQMIQADANGQLYGRCVTNGTLAGPDYRLFQEGVKCDGQTDRARWSITLWWDGVDKVPIEAAGGNVILTDIVSAADDAAAATAGVPIKGLYHTSGAVKVRLT